MGKSLEVNELMDAETYFEDLKTCCSKRIGRKLGTLVAQVARSGGDKFDLAMDRVEGCAEGVREYFDHIHQEGYGGLTRHVTDYVRREPKNALLLALGGGLLLGWVTKRR